MLLVVVLMVVVLLVVVVVVMEVWVVLEMVGALEVKLTDELGAGKLFGVDGRCERDGDKWDSEDGSGGPRGRRLRGHYPKRRSRGVEDRHRLRW